MKKRNPGKGCDTIPATIDVVLNVVRYILTFKVYYRLNFLSELELKMKKHWLSFPKIWRDKERLYWYCFAISLLFVGILGLRGAECYENKDKEYEGYGIYI